MSILLPTKHKFEGIGKAGATAAFLALAADPATIGLTKGFVGKILFKIMTEASSFFASKGLVFLNVTISKVEVLIEQKAFDGSWDEAFEAINKAGGTLTPEQTLEIDKKVMEAFDKFADMSRNK